MLTLTAHILSWNNTACAWLLHKEDRQIHEAFHKKKGIWLSSQGLSGGIGSSLSQSSGHSIHDLNSREGT